AAAKGAFAVPPQDLRATVRVRDVLRMRRHPSDSGTRDPNRVRPTKLYVRNARGLSPACRNRTHHLRNTRRQFILPDPTRVVPRLVSSNLARFAGLYWRRQHMWLK